MHLDADEKGCVAKEKAYIFISSEVNDYERFWLRITGKISGIEKYYKNLGYEVHHKKVKEINDFAGIIAKHPEIKAIAYFGHAATLPSRMPLEVRLLL
jgi:hypothetical protein